MNSIVLGILAHVDGGKTTLSEAILYRSGQLRQLGRVDRQNAFLDTNALERERGITIFSKQAVFPLGALQVTLLDTPGHVDFSSEMERALQAMDCALLVISGTDGVQSHTRTLWRLLEHYHIPTVIFVNKMDLPGTDKPALLRLLQDKLSGGVTDFTEPQGEAFWESAALSEEGALSEYLEQHALSAETLRRLIAQRKLFPCWFGSALKLEGVDGLLVGLERFLPRPHYTEEFSARVYKVETQPERLTHLKITGGTLRVKDVLAGQLSKGEGIWEEKIDQIRLYSGEKFRTLDAASAGMLCAVTGLSHTYAGQSFGPAPSFPCPALEPLFTYQILLPPEADPHVVLAQLRTLEEEDPQLHVVWEPQLRELRLQLMGQVQGEILKRIIADRFGLEVDFGPGSIVYKETLAAPSVGAGHFEPLRHYAEVHLLLEPGEPGSGLRFVSQCDTDTLAVNWQRLILGQLRSTSHRGVLTGSPITDLTVTLLAGRAHPKHTEGGDFRQAACRALRQGLMCGESILLEPWYSFRLEIPQEYLGRALADFQHFGGDIEAPEFFGPDAVLTGGVPVAALGDYSLQLAAYTKGQGQLSCTLKGYFPCQDQDEIVARIGYDPLRDTENPADSVFCSHGAGHIVPWNEAPSHMHVSNGLSTRPGSGENTRPAAVPRTAPYAGTLAQDAELQAIFERTYGPIKTPDPRPMKPSAPAPSLPDKVEVDLENAAPEYLLVDGYNIIFAWDELKTVAQQNLDAARALLIELLCNYQAYRGSQVIVVFDAYKVHGGVEKVEKQNNITVVYTKEAETADAYIERATYHLGKENRVRVATSDGLVQVIILGHGALRLSAASLHQEVETAIGQIAALVRKSQLPSPSRSLAHAYEKAKSKETRREC